MPVHPCLSFQPASLCAQGQPPRAQHVNRLSGGRVILESFRPQISLPVRVQVSQFAVKTGAALAS